MTKLNGIRYMLVMSLIIAPLTSSANATQEGAKDFIKNVSEKAIILIQDKKTTDSVKQKELISLFERSVDTDWIAKFAMGSHWKHATDKQKEQYTKLHHQFLVNSYVPKFKQYTNQKIVLKKTFSEGDNEYLIETEILQAKGPAINVSYKVREIENGKYRIFDVVAEGVSLITTQRSEFGSILSRKGVDYLIKQLKAKV